MGGRAGGAGNRCRLRADGPGRRPSGPASVSRARQPLQLLAAPPPVNILTRRPVHAAPSAGCLRLSISARSPRPRRSRTPSRSLRRLSATRIRARVTLSERVFR